MSAIWFNNKDLPANSANEHTFMTAMVSCLIQKVKDGVLISQDR